MEKLRQEAHNDFQFAKENEDEKDNMYIFSIDWKAPFYQKYLCAGARYRVMVTPSQTGSTVWFYLSECSDDYALDHFAEKLRGFMIKCRCRSWVMRTHIRPSISGILMPWCILHRMVQAGTVCQNQVTWCV